MERLYTVNEVAEVCRVTRGAVYIWMREGQLPFVVVGGHRRIRQSDLEAFVKPGSVELAA